MFTEVGLKPFFLTKEKRWKKGHEENKLNWDADERVFFVCLKRFM